MKITVMDGLLITLIGLVVVFAILFILVMLIEFLHLILKDKKKSEKQEQAKQEPKKARVLHPVAVPCGDAIEKDGEFIAAVSAAVATYISKPNGSFEIKSIKEK